MEFGDSTYTFKLCSNTSIVPTGYVQISRHEVGHGALARYLINKANNCPIFHQTLDSFCTKSDDLTDPYYSDLEDAYLRELSSRLAALDLYYKRNTESSFKDAKPMLPWNIGGGGSVGSGSHTSSSGAGEFDHLEPSIKAHMETMRRISNARPKKASSSTTSTTNARKEETKNAETEWLELNLYYADQHKTPVFNQAYEIQLANGTVKKGNLNDKGFMRLEGIPKGNTKVSIVENPAQKAKLKNLREQLAAALDELVEQTRQDSKNKDSVLDDMNPIEHGLVYVGSFLMGGADMVTDLWAFAKIVGQGLVKANLAYLDLLEDFFTGDVREIQRKLEKAQKEGVGAYKGATEISEALYLLTTDEETWEILTSFVEEYWDASHGVDITRSTAPIILEIIITILTAGAGAPVLAANLGKAAKLTDKATDLVKQIIKAKKAIGQKAVKQTSTGKRLLIPVDGKFKTNKNTTPKFPPSSQQLSTKGSLKRKKKEAPPPPPPKKTIELDAGTGKTPNRVLEKPEPNTVYKVTSTHKGQPATYTYETDDKGRTVRVKGKLKRSAIGDQKERDKLHRNKKTQAEYGGPDKEYDGGHLIATLFQGPAEKINLVPQLSKQNRYGDWRKMEKEWANKLKKGKEVEVDISMKYGDDGTPIGFTVIEKIDGKMSPAKYFENLKDV